jgi:hypothetical protein
MIKDMISKFAGTCVDCKGYMPVGTSILWERGMGARHKDACPAPALVTTTVAWVGQNAPNAAKVVVAAQSRIVDFLNVAKTSGLKFPKVRFIAPDGKSELRLSIAGDTSKYPGSIQVKINGQWVGRINTDGTATRMDDVLLETLNKIASNPAQAAKEYGALNGCCSFCGLALTDEGSVEVGYGPICAKNYGLPHTAKGSKAIKPIGVIEPLPDDPTPGTFVTIPEFELVSAAL